jgi:hypothetical protein
VVEKTQLELLRPATFEILEREPYVQAVFLHAFLSLKSEDEDAKMDERQLEAHIVKGYRKVSYRQKVEITLYYREEFLSDHTFRNKIFSRG